MRAYLLRGSGVADLEQVPSPEPGPGEVLLRVELTALNHLDVFARAGLTGPGIREHPYPHVSGCDVVGTVAGVGPGVDDWPRGQRVVVYPSMSCGRCAFCHRGETSMCAEYRIWGEQTWGGLAEYTVAPADNLVAVPDGVDPRAVAAAPVAFTTAWRALVTAGGLRVGETVLIVGIGGGVATAALAIARHAGARVLVTSGSDGKLDRALALGADAGVNHRGADVPAWVRERTDGRGADLVLDSVGAATWPGSIASLATGGRLCVCGATSGDGPRFSIRELYQSHRRIIGAPMGGRPDFDAVLRLVFAGELVPVIDSVHAAGAVEEAFTLVEQSRQFGKVLVNWS